MHRGAKKTNDELNTRKELNLNDGNINVMFQKSRHIYQTQNSKI